MVSAISFGQFPVFGKNTLFQRSQPVQFRLRHMGNTRDLFLQDFKTSRQTDLVIKMTRLLLKMVN